MRPERVLAAGAAAALLLGACGLTAPPGGTKTVTVAPTPATSASEPPVQLQDFSNAEMAALRIRNIGCGGVSVGSGFAIGKHLLVTNRHVVGGAAVLQVQTFDGRDIDVTATGATTMADLAIVKTKESLPGSIELAKSNPDVGEDVTAVGYPLGGQLTTTTGHVLDYGFDPVGWSSLPMLINDAPIEHGSSGSPLLNPDGQLVGVVYATSEDERRYAVPVEVLNEAIASPDCFNASAACNGVPVTTTIPKQATECSATVYAGARTSCPFALKVEEAWLEAGGGGDVVVTAHSPVTNLNYRLSCAAGNPVICTADTGATVYIKDS